MKTFKHALTLALAAGLLSACGGGGGSNSPDRPGLSLNPTTLRIAFVDNNNVLAATGNDKISARLLGKQTDGIDTEQTPELNVTASDETTWSIVETNNVAAIGDIRDAGGNTGSVQDINSILRLNSDDDPVQLTLKAIHVFDGTSYPVSSSFTVQPPIPLGTPQLDGPAEILFDPLTPETRTVGYQLLQALQQLPQPENKTREAVFCSTNETVLAFGETQPPDSDTADATVTNPFPGTDGTQAVSLEVFAMEEGRECSDRGKEDSENPGETIQAIDVLPVTISPASVANDDDIRVCGIINPATDACNSNGSFNESYLADCRGLDTPDSSGINVPAGELLQLVAELKYTNPNNPNQTPILRYNCSAPQRLIWSADSSTIFSSGPDAAEGSAALISRSEYQAIKDSNPSSTVTGNFDNTPGTNGGNVEDTLTLNLIDSQVTDISIVPVPEDRDPADTLPLNILKTKLEYRAECTFGENDEVVANCGDSCVSWSVADSSIIEASPSVGSNTFVSSPDYTTEGQSQLTATFTCSNFSGSQPPSDSRTITTEEDAVVELHLLQVSNASEPDVRSVDSFSCVGRTDLIGTLSEGDTYIQGAQQFYAHALFESDDSNTDPVDMQDVTQADAVIFSALPGYANNDGSCTTGIPLDIPIDTGNGEENGGLLSMIPIIGNLLDFYLGDVIDILTIPLEQLPGLPGGEGTPGLSSGPAAEFSAANKGQLQSKGLLRLSTVCVQAFIDENGDGELSENEKLAMESSTVFAMPVADDALLNYSNEVCEILEPVLTLGSGVPIVGDVLPAGVLMPLIYGVSLITDPVLSVLATNDDGGVLPVEEILDALITGNFSELSIPGQPDFTDAPFGLGALTGVLLDGMDEIPGLGTLVDGLDACLIDPLTSTVSSLLSTLLTLDPSNFGELTGIGFSEDCEAVFSGIPIPSA